MAGIFVTECDRHKTWQVVLYFITSWKNLDKQTKHKQKHCSIAYQLKVLGIKYNIFQVPQAEAKPRVTETDNENNIKLQP